MAADALYNQSIPRPKDHYVRVVPKWTGHLYELKKHLDTDMLLRVSDKLTSDVKSASWRAQDEGNTILVDDNSYAVVVPLVLIDEEIFIVLTKRAGHMEADPGHVAFPGGKLESGENFLAAALRETYEEIGLDRKDIERTAFLGVFERPLSEAQRNPSGNTSKRTPDAAFTEDNSRLSVHGKQTIAAFMTLLKCLPDFKPNLSEVEKIFLLPLADLLEEDLAWDEIWSWPDGSKSEIHFFSEPKVLGRDLIWGLTARIVTELLAVLVDCLEV